MDAQRITGSVSVIVPVYNAARTIEKTLRSALEQTVPPVEIIVVDDGSTDSTLAVLKELEESSPCLRVVQQTNRGVSRARNTALSLSRGEWVAPLDADDLWHPAKLEWQLERAQAAQWKVDVVYCWSTDIDENDIVMDYRTDLDKFEGNVFVPMIYTNFLQNSSVPLIKREALERIGGWDPALQRCADWDLYLKLASRGNFALASGFLVGYRQSSSSLSRDVALMRGSFEAITNRVKGAVPHLPPRVLDLSRSAFEAYMGDLLWDSGDRVGAIAAFIRAVRADPSWFGRPSTQRRIKQMVGVFLKSPTKRNAPLMRPNTPPVGRPFSELRPTPMSEESDGPASAEHRAFLSSIDVQGIYGTG